MNPETLEALKGSIEKWRKIVEEGGEDNGPINCPLCKRFYHKDCKGCPVNDVTKSADEWQGGCVDSPYEEWHRHTLGGVADTPAKIELARAELDFLRSLLPKEETGQ